MAIDFGFFRIVFPHYEATAERRASLPLVDGSLNGNVIYVQNISRAVNSVLSHRNNIMKINANVTKHVKSKLKIK